MSVVAESGIPTRPEGFALLDRQHALFPPTAEDWRRYGSVAIAEPMIVETPSDVLDAGRIFTNSSQLEEVVTRIGRELVPLNIAFFREERRTAHLGTTVAVPYVLAPNGNGGHRLTPYMEAAPVPGEDLRLTPGVRMAGHLGVHEGWQASTVHAWSAPGKPDIVGGIKQVFYWGPTLGTLEPVAEDDSGAKNTTIAPAYTSDDDTTVHLFPRPFPDISYRTIGSLPQINSSTIAESHGTIITKGMYPPGALIHGGPNMAKPCGPYNIELDIHEAYRRPLDDRTNALYYRLGRYGYELPTRDLPTGRLAALGTVAERSDFPAAPPKPPEGEVGDYTPILYGPVGRNGRMVAGMSDTTIVTARVIRTFPL